MFVALVLLLGVSAAQADDHQDKDFQLCVNGICIGDGGVGLGPQYPGHGGGGYGPGYGPGYGDHHGPGYGDYGSEFVRCDSINRRYNECYFDTFRVRNVRLYRQHSKAMCARGRDFGVQRGVIWVQNGCRATFEIIR